MNTLTFVYLRAGFGNARWSEFTCVIYHASPGEYSLIRSLPEWPTPRRRPMQESRKETTRSLCERLLVGAHWIRTYLWLEDLHRCIYETTFAPDWISELVSGIRPMYSPYLWLPKSTAQCELKSLDRLLNQSHEDRIERDRKRTYGVKVI